MTRSFMLAVSGFALVSAACTPSDDVAMDDTDDEEVMLAEDDGDATSPMDDPDMDATEPGMMDTDADAAGPGGASNMDALRQDLLNDMENDAATADDMPMGDTADFGMDYAGLWGTEAQCSQGLGWAFSASTITTPDGEVCSLTELNENADDVMLTASCTLEDGTIEEREYTLTLDGNGAMSVMTGETDETVTRCVSMEEEMDEETGDETGETDE